MPSIQAKHQRGCSSGKVWTTLAAATSNGCSCSPGPTYYVVVRERSRAQKVRVGHDPKLAERARRKIHVELDDGEYVAQRNISFSRWGEEWLAALERKRSTVRSYEPTIAYAVELFGGKHVRRLRVDDISDYNRLLRDRGMSASTRAKHLRVLGACLQAAVRREYAVRNPVRDLGPSERPRPERKEAAYFTNEELPRLFAEVPDGLHRTILLLALKTGMREGEILALEWGDIDLSEAVIRVRRTYTGREISSPKNHERRDVDLTSEVVELLVKWWAECGKPTDNRVLVFPGESENGHLSPSNILRRHFYPAMERAGIPRVGPTGERRVFHSLRHTFSKRALETGSQLTWLSRHLGHSSLKVTTDIYGHWERAERRAQARRMEGAFGV
jgi:integrase